MTIYLNAPRRGENSCQSRAYRRGTDNFAPAVVSGQSMEKKGTTPT